MGALPRRDGVADLPARPRHEEPPDGQGLGEPRPPRHRPHPPLLGVRPVQHRRGDRPGPAGRRRHRRPRRGQARPGRLERAHGVGRGAGWAAAGDLHRDHAVRWPAPVLPRSGRNDAAQLAGQGCGQCGRPGRRRIRSRTEVGHQGRRVRTRRRHRPGRVAGVVGPSRRRTPVYGQLSARSDPLHHPHPLRVRGHSPGSANASVRPDQTPTTPSCRPRPTPSAARSGPS